MLTFIHGCRLTWFFLTALALSYPVFAAPAEMPETQLDVIAIEYPPYTSEPLLGGGLAFQSLRKALDNQPQGNSIILKPHFLPPARANLLIRQGRWSVSFYPPLQPDPAFHWLKLETDPIELGLFRLRGTDAVAPGSGAGWAPLDQLRGRVAVGRHTENNKKSGPRTALQQSQLELVPVDSLEQGFQLLAKGRVEYVFSEKVAGFLIGRYITTDDATLALEFSDSPLYTTSMGIWVNRQDEAGELLYQLLKDAPPRSASATD